MNEQENLPLPETELPKPEKDLPLPEKEITSGVNSTISSNQTPNPNKSKNSLYLKAVLVIILLFFLYPIGVILMWFMTKWPKWVKILLTIPIIFIIVGILTVMFTYSMLDSIGPSGKSTPSPTPNQVVCTQEALLCPDGVTYVSREGPNCEFTQCPEVPEISPEVSPVPTTSTSTSSSNLQ